MQRTTQHSFGAGWIVSWDQNRLPLQERFKKPCGCPQRWRNRWLHVRFESQKMDDLFARWPLQASRVQTHPQALPLVLSMNNTFCVFRGSRGSVWSLWYKTVERLVSFCGFLCHDVPLTLPWVSFLNRNTATRVNQPLDTDSVGTVGLWVPFGSTQRDPPWATSSCSDLGPGATREVSCANVTISTGFSGSPTRIHTSDSLTRLQMWWFAEHGFHYHAQVSQEVHLWMIKISRNKWCTHTHTTGTGTCYVVCIPPVAFCSGLNHLGRQAHRRNGSSASKRCRGATTLSSLGWIWWFRGFPK